MPTEACTIMQRNAEFHGGIRKAADAGFGIELDVGSDEGQDPRGP